MLLLAESSACRWDFMLTEIQLPQTARQYQIRVILDRTQHSAHHLTAMLECHPFLISGHIPAHLQPPLLVVIEIVNFAGFSAACGCLTPDSLCVLIVTLTWPLGNKQPPVAASVARSASASIAKL